MTVESQLKKEIKDTMDRRGVFWSAVKGGSFSKIGDPDLILCCRGRYIAVEAKTFDGVQSECQKVRMDQIRKAGGIYILARSLKDVTDVIDRIEKDGA